MSLNFKGIQALSWLFSEFSLLALFLTVAVFVYMGLRAKGSRRDESRTESRKARAKDTTKDLAVNGVKFLGDPFWSSLPRGRNEFGEINRNDFPNYQHVQGCLYSRNDEREFVIGNPREPYYFENEFCRGLWLPMFRPTADNHLDNPEGWPYADHFKGRKRLWEHRLQFQFKVPIEGNILIGTQQPEYVPLNGASKRILKVLKAALKRVVGDGFYHSYGEPPSKDGSETEMPTFVMPLWAADQFIETPEGEVPPELTDANFGDYGYRRTAGFKEFVEKLTELRCRPGPTYTLATWGISPFLDAVKWTITGAGPFTFDFNTVGALPPVMFCAYRLRPGSTSEDDGRHLESRKDYLFKLEFWSSKKRPSRQDLTRLFPDVQLEPPHNLARQTNWWNLSACCSARTQ